MKEHERREYLKTLSEEKRKEEESKFEEMKRKHEDHPKVNHPVRTVRHRNRVDMVFVANFVLSLAHKS